MSGNGVRMRWMCPAMVSGLPRVLVGGDTHLRGEGYS